MVHLPTGCESIKRSSAAGVKLRTHDRNAGLVANVRGTPTRAVAGKWQRRQLVASGVGLGEDKINILHLHPRIVVIGKKGQLRLNHIKTLYRRLAEYGPFNSFRMKQQSLR